MKIIMVHSYKGGTGKSLFSINLANGYATRGSKVLLIEADFEMPSYTKIFDKHKPDVFFNNALASRGNLTSSVYEVAENWDVIYASPDYDPKDKVHSVDLEWFNSRLDYLKTELQDLDYDVIIFDLAPGKNLFTINTLVLSSEIMILMRPDNYSVKNTLEIFENFYRYADFLKNKDIYVIINQVPKDERMSSLIDEWRRNIEYRLPVVSTVTSIEFEVETGYHVASDQIILPHGDPFLTKLQSFLKK